MVNTGTAVRPIFIGRQEPGLIPLCMPPTDNFNRGDNAGTGYFEVNQRRGRRWSAATGFLKLALKRPNLTLWTGAQGTRLIVEGGGVTGVEMRHRDMQIVGRTPGSGGVGRLRPG